MTGGDHQCVQLVCPTCHCVMTVPLDDLLAQRPVTCPRNHRLPGIDPRLSGLREVTGWVDDLARSITLAYAHDDRSDEPR